MHISVVIPVYNEEKFIKHCLDALFRQTRMADIVYVIDNNSTDRTVPITRQYKNIKVIKEPTQGICAATKKGLDTAAKHCGIILRCDADCIPAADWVEKMEAAFIHTKSTQAVTGPGIAYDTNKFAQLLITWLYMKPYFFFTGIALGYIPLFGSSFGIRADAWTAIAKHTHLYSHQTIHDDIDISYHLEGDIKYDSTLVMPISARPFRNLGKMPQRYIAGFRSIFLHWPEYAPWQKIVNRNK